MVKTNKLFSKYSLIILSVLIASIIFLSLRKTLEFYFYTDDYAVLYHFQNNIPYIYPFYRFVPKIYGPIYNFFGLRTEPYFLMALVSHFFASLGIYFFVKRLTKNNLIGIFSSLIFATGYIGVDSLSQMNTASVDNLNVLFTTLLLLFFLRFLEEKKFYFYFLALILFYLGVTIFPFRAFPMILFLVTTDIVFTFQIHNLKKIFSWLTNLFLRILPFLFIYYSSGLAAYGTERFAGFLNKFSIEHLKIPFSILGSMVTPRSLNIPLAHTRVGIIFLIILGAIIFVGRKPFPHLAKALLLTTILIFEGFIGNFILLPVFASNAELNRYLSLSLFGYAATISLAPFLFVQIFLKEKKFKMLLAGILPLFLIILFSQLSFRYQQFIVKERSLPTRHFFKELKTHLPTISRKTVFYFDRANYYPIPQRFGPIILGAYMPAEATLAVHYQVPISKIKIAKNFDELTQMIKKGIVNLEDIYTFYYDENGLINTTNDVKNAFLDQRNYSIPIQDITSSLSASATFSIFGTESVLKNYKNSASLSINPEILISLKSIPSYSPSVLRFNLRVTPIIPKQLPLFDLTSLEVGNKEVFLTNPDEKIIERIKSDFNISNKNLYFAYLLARKDYLEKTTVEVSSFHPDQPKEFLFDDREKTHWFSGEGPWQVHEIPWLKLDLGETKRINRIIWTNISSVRTPKDYEILTSINGIDWQTVKRITQGTKKGEQEMILEEFPTTVARFVMVKIYKTTDGWAPGFSEIEVIEDRFSDVDLFLAKQLAESPFRFVADRKGLNSALNYAAQNTQLKVLVKTNRDKEFNKEEFQILPIYLDGLFHPYELVLPIGGLYFTELKIESLNFPAKIELQNLRIESKNLNY